MASTSSSYLISDEQIAKSFNEIRKRLEKINKSAIITWSTPTLEEVTPNVKRSLRKKYDACSEKGFKAAKIAGLYAYWIAKLKPIFSPFTKSKGLNEYAGIMIGIGFIRERLKISIDIKEDELIEMCYTLRYHTTSPHMLMHQFNLWIERQKLEQEILELNKRLKIIA